MSESERETMGRQSLPQRFSIPSKYTDGGPGLLIDEPDLSVWKFYSAFQKGVSYEIVDNIEQELNSYQRRVILFQTDKNRPSDLEDYSGKQGFIANCFHLKGANQDVLEEVKADFIVNNFALPKRVNGLVPYTDICLELQEMEIMGNQEGSGIYESDQQSNGSCGMEFEGGKLSSKNMTTVLRVAMIRPVYNRETT
jgi:hypothetical protein